MFDFLRKRDESKEKLSSSGKRDMVRAMIEEGYTDAEIIQELNVPDYVIRHQRRVMSPRDESKISVIAKEFTALAELQQQMRQNDKEQRQEIIDEVIDSLSPDDEKKSEISEFAEILKLLPQQQPQVMQIPSPIVSQQPTVNARLTSTPQWSNLTDADILSFIDSNLPKQLVQQIKKSKVPPILATKLFPTLPSSIVERAFKLIKARK